MNPLFHEAEKCLVNGEYVSSLRILQKIIDEEPYNAFAFVKMGAIHQKIGNHKEAIKYFNSALDCDPYNAEALYSKGLALNQIGSYKEGMKHIAKSFGLYENSDFLKCVSSSMSNVDDDVETRNYIVGFLMCTATRLNNS